MLPRIHLGISHGFSSGVFPKTPVNIHQQFRQEFLLGSLSDYFSFSFSIFLIGNTKEFFFSRNFKKSCNCTLNKLSAMELSRSSFQLKEIFQQLQFLNEFLCNFLHVSSRNYPKNSYRSPSNFFLGIIYDFFLGILSISLYFVSRNFQTIQSVNPSQISQGIPPAFSPRIHRTVP